MSGETPIGLHIRAFNWHLYNARLASGLTQHELCDRLGLARNIITDLECLKRVPTMTQMEAIALELDRPVDVLFPSAVLAITAKKLGTSVRIPVPASALENLIGAASEPSHEIMEAVEQATDRASLIARLHEAVATLSPIEQRVIKRRFGLRGSTPRSRRETALLEDFDSGERARQIEADALRKLRHPSCRQLLGGSDAVTAAFG